MSKNKLRRFLVAFPGLFLVNDFLIEARQIVFNVLREQWERGANEWKRQGRGSIGVR